MSRATLAAQVVQFPISLDIGRNEAALRQHLGEAQPGTLVVFPEGALSGYEQDASFVHAIEVATLEAAMHRLKRLAVERKLHLAFGTCLRESSHWYNAGIYFGPAGEEFIYRKVNLAMNERAVFTAGDRLECFMLEHAGERIPFAFQLCREIRFPEQWAHLARRGARVFLYPTNAHGDAAQAAVWRSHLISRAAENQRFVLCANVAAPAQKCPSMIIDPKGYVRWEVLSEASGIGRAAIDVSESSDWYLNQSRVDLLPARS